ncbi:hypothetical protein DPMN_136953 [Dreissena polymorpha]|uniref:Uncharacterized protein n=1 Tax=Dreissena polymorpha TaxID=45954 RepID=A0A9D4JD51_DREPO|nr:hypothetical protein DPMN_136953 [Dreissena polymorpha]
MDAGTIRGLLGFLSVDGLPRPITPMTTRHPHGTTGSNMPSTRRPCGLAQTVRAELRTYTTETRTNTASIRTKHDLRQTDTNFNKSRLIFYDSISLQ